MALRYLYLAIFGLIGVFARYFFNSLITNIVGAGFPAATICINILGSFLIAVVYVTGTQHLIFSEDIRIALMAGLLGGFTTFSAFSLDTVAMFAEGQYLNGGLYVAGSVGGGIIAAVFGLYIGKQVIS